MKREVRQFILEGFEGMMTQEQEEEARQAKRNATLEEKIQESKNALILASEMSQTYYHKPLIITYSGGKDSDVMLHLAESCLKPSEFEVLNSHTSVDAPETVYHIRDVFKRLNHKGIKATVFYPRYKDGKQITMWNLIPKKQLPPTRLVRYCCSVLKEVSTPNRMIAVGVRESESIRRKGKSIFFIRGSKKDDARYYTFEHAKEVYKDSKEMKDDVWDCVLIQKMKNNKDVIVNPIYYWFDKDIWNFINYEKIKVNSLYQCGYNRIGCIGCPMATYKQILKEFSDYPKFKKNYILAFDKLVEILKAKNSKIRWKDGNDVFDWWIEENKHQVEGQLSFDDVKEMQYANGQKTLSP